MSILVFVPAIVIGAIVLVAAGISARVSVAEQRPKPPEPVAADRRPAFRLRIIQGGGQGSGQGGGQGGPDARDQASGRHAATVHLRLISGDARRAER